MLSPFPAIEVEPTHVFGILQHQIDRIGTPNAVRTAEVEPFSYSFLTESLVEQSKDLADDSGFSWIHRNAVADGDWPTVRIASPRFVDWLGSVSEGSAACGGAF